MISPIVSVIMPVFNAEKYLAAAIDSILNQTFMEFEFIIIDDCSTDSSFEILEKYKNSDHRIRLFRNSENYKLPRTLNFGISKAKGEFIVRMDADDISLPERISMQLEFLQKNNTIGVCGTWYDVYDETLCQIKYQEQKPLSNPEIYIHLDLSDNPIGHPTTMCRREIFELCQYSEHRKADAEDYSLWCCLKNNGVKFANIPIVLLKYRLSNTSISAVNSKNISCYWSKNVQDNLFRLGLNTKEIDAYLFRFILSVNIFTKIFYILRYPFLLKKLRLLNDEKQIYPQIYFAQFLKSLSLVAKVKRKTL